MPNPTSGKIGLTELPVSILGPSGFSVQDYDLDTGLNLGSHLKQGGLTPDNIGQLVWNASGSIIPAGSLVYVSGWNAANNLPQISLANSLTRFTPAQLVTLAAISNGASGLAGLHYSLTGQNTNAATVGDAVYLDNVVPGGYVMTNAPGTTNYYQIVGRVAVKSATVGVIDFNLVTEVPPQIGAQRFSASLITVGTAAAAYEQLVECPYAGVLGNIFIQFPVALAQSDTNFVTFQINNRGQGAGNTPLLATAAGANSTKVTGGFALAQYTRQLLTQTGGPFTVNAGDILDVQMTVTGTLANTLPGGSILFVLVPT